MPENTSASTKKPHFHKHFDTVRRMVDFLDATYKGGPEYKEAFDIDGNPILIEHEIETETKTQATAYAMADGMTVQTRYQRRKRQAVFENHFKPIVNKVFGYVSRTDPARDEGISDELQQYEIPDKMETLLEEGLRNEFYYVGLDAPTSGLAPGEAISRAQQIQSGAGDPYIVLVDPRSVVDWSTDPNDEDIITRIVIRDEITTKPSLTDEEQVEVFYTEWTELAWTKYQEVEDEEAEGGKKLVVISGPVAHGFMRSVDGQPTPFCPYWKYDPPFPSTDVAEINRALFNMESLLDEELFNNTFTRHVITGATASEVEKASRSTGSMLVVKNPAAAIHTIGAIPGQSQSLAERVDQLREALYLLANLESVGQKNVAEAADKKRRDLEQLYTMLTAISKSAEKMENELLWSLRVIDDPMSDERRTIWPDKFDVMSTTDLVAEIREMAAIPFMPPAAKRDKVRELLAHVFPYEDTQKYNEEVDKLVDISPETVDALDRLLTQSQLTPDMVANLLGVPDSMRQDFMSNTEEAKQHAIQEEANRRMAMNSMLENSQQGDNADTQSSEADAQQAEAA